VGLIVDTGEASIIGVSYNGTPLSDGDVADANSVGAPAGSFVLWIKSVEAAITPKTFTLTKTGKTATTITINVVDSEGPMINSTSGEGYATIQAAIDAATSGDTIVLGDDVNLGSNEEGAITVNKRITLDLAGHTITSGWGYWAIKVDTTGDLTIVDSGTTGHIVNTAALGEAIRSYGKLTINGGTYNADYAIIMSGESCDVTINEGEFNGWIYSNGSNSGPTLTITDGEFNRNFYLASANTVTTISGGTFTADATDEPYPDVAVIEIDAGTLNISGGTFTFAINTPDNLTATANTGRGGDFKGVIVAVKPSNSTLGSNYGSPVVVSITGGTFANTLGDAIVLVDQRPNSVTEENGITVNISGGTVEGGVAVYDSEGQDSVLSYNGEVSGQITASDLGVVNGALNYLGTDDLIIAGQVTGTGNLTTFSGTVSGSINGTITAQINANGIDTMSGEITLSPGTVDTGKVIRIIGTFPQTGIDGDFEGDIITGPEPTYVTSMEITCSAVTVAVGETLQLAVNVLPDGASNEVLWSVYVNDREKGSINETGLFTATAVGTVTVIVKALDGSLKDDTIVITVTREVD
jgi:hypothetical protein